MPRSAMAGFPTAPRAGSFDGDVIRDLLASLCAGDTQVLTGTADAVTFPGTTVINSPNVDMCTLATPIAGNQPLGDDGKMIEIFDASGQLHQVWTSTNCIPYGTVPAARLRFNGTVGSNVCLQAWSGYWVVVGTPNGVTVG